MNFVPIMLGSAAFVFLNFSLPIFTRSMGANAVAIGGLYTTFTLTMLIIRPLVGAALDRYGRRWFFIAAFAFYAVAMIVFAHAQTLFDFYVARFCQGIGASLMWVSARTIIADVTSLADRGQMMGKLLGCSVQGSMLGAFYGFTLLGFMPMAQAWYWAFFGYALVAGCGFVLSWLVQTETAPVKPANRASLVLSTRLRKILLIVFISGFASALIEPIYLIYLQDKFQLPISYLAMAFFPAGIVFAVLPQYAGHLADRYGRGPIIALGLLVAASVSISLPWLPSIFLVAFVYTLSAVGWALATPAEDALVGDFADQQTRGRVFGIKEASASFGAALGPLVGGVLYEWQGAHWSFVTNGLLLMIAALLVVSWFTKSEPIGLSNPRESTPPTEK